MSLGMRFEDGSDDLFTIEIFQGKLCKDPVFIDVAGAPPINAYIRSQVLSLTQMIANSVQGAPPACFNATISTGMSPCWYIRCVHDAALMLLVPPPQYACSIRIRAKGSNEGVWC